MQPPDELMPVLSAADFAAATSIFGTFLTGGGASVDTYGKAIRKGGLGCTSHIEPIPLPTHPRIADFEGDTRLYQRISIACGWVQNAFSLGSIIPAKEVKDDIATIGPARGRSDRDEVYAK